MPDPEYLLTLHDVAQRLGVPLDTLYRWRSLGHGPPGIRLGRHVRVRSSDLEAWLDTQADRMGLSGRQTR